jgi:hypothetical protein
VQSRTSGRHRGGARHPRRAHQGSRRLAHRQEPGRAAPSHALGLARTSNAASTSSSSRRARPAARGAARHWAFSSRRRRCISTAMRTQARPNPRKGLFPTHPSSLRLPGASCAGRLPSRQVAPWPGVRPAPPAPRHARARAGRRTARAGPDRCPRPSLGPPRDAWPCRLLAAPGASIIGPAAGGWQGPARRRATARDRRLASRIVSGGGARPGSSTGAGSRARPAGRGAVIGAAAGLLCGPLYGRLLRISLSGKLPSLNALNSTIRFYLGVG